MDDCAKGARCYDIDAMFHGVCRALCTGSPFEPECEGTANCIAIAEVLFLCIPDCLPLVQDCGEGLSCVPNLDEFGCVIDGSGDHGAVNEPCEAINECDPGLVCIDAVMASSACGPGKCCQPFCPFVDGQDGDCPNPDQKCVQWLGEDMQVVEGAEDVGVCAAAG